MSVSIEDGPQAAPVVEEQRHPLLRRLSHWLFALSILIMIGSGWRIYNDAPILPFHFPLWITLGGDTDYSYDLHGESGTANAIAWHLAGMWLLVGSVGVYLVHGIVSGHFRRDFLPLTPKAFIHDFVDALRFRLDHRLGVYNAVQKVFYWGVLFAIVMMVLTGLAIWKPVQLGWLTWLFGGFPTARVVHFFFMSAIVAFLVVHVALVLVVPKTFVAMTLGRATATPHGQAQKGQGFPSVGHSNGCERNSWNLQPHSALDPSRAARIRTTGPEAPDPHPLDAGVSTRSFLACAADKWLRRSPSGGLWHGPLNGRFQSLGFGGVKGQSPLPWLRKTRP